jgi:hypothetical protein
MVERCLHMSWVLHWRTQSTLYRNGVNVVEWDGRHAAVRFPIGEWWKRCTAIWLTTLDVVLSVMSLAGGLFTCRLVF